MEKLKNIIIDADPGDDDVASILWVIASGKFNVLGITVTNGNVGVDKCVINALRTLEVCKKTEIPVFSGAYRPLIRPSIEASWIHGEDGLGDLGLPMPSTKASPGYAPIEMIRLAKNSPEPITILALGPLTNVALALLLDPSFEENVEKIIFMGGVMRFSGNQSPRASYNVEVDPEAAKVVYESSIPVVQIGLDVCDLVNQEVQDLDKIAAAKTEVTEFLIKILSFRREKAVRYIYDDSGKIVNQIKASDQAKGRKDDGIGLNDLTATGYLINPEWFKVAHVRIDIATSGICDGETVVDYKGLSGKEPNAYFAFGVDGKSLVKQWVVDMTSHHIS